MIPILLPRCSTFWRRRRADSDPGSRKQRRPIFSDSQKIQKCRKEILFQIRILLT